MSRIAVLLAAVLFVLTPGVASATIVFDRGTDIYAAGDDGSNVHLLAAASWLGMDNGLSSPAVSPSGDTLLFTGETLRNKVIGGHANWYGLGTDGVYRLSGGQFQRLSVAPTPAGTRTAGDIVPEPGGSNYAYQAYDCVEVSNGHGGYDNVCGYKLNVAPLGQGSAGASQFATYCSSASDPTVDPASATPRIAYDDCQKNFGDPTLDDDQAILVVSGPSHQGETIVAVGADTDKVDHPSKGFLDPSFSADGAHLVAFNSGGIHDYFDSGFTEHMDPIPGGLVVYDDLTQQTAGRTVLLAPSDGNSGYERLSSPRFMGTDKIVFAARNAVWTVPASCNNCHFPADATKIFDGNGSAVTGVAWTSGNVTPGSAPPPPPQNTGGGGGTTNNGGGTNNNGGGTNNNGGGTNNNGGTNNQNTPGKASPLAFATKSAKVKKGIVVINIKCGAASTCQGTLTLTFKQGRKTITLGKVSYKLAGGKSGGFKVKLSSAGKKALKKARHHKLTANVTASVKGGQAASGTVKLTG